MIGNHRRVGPARDSERRPTTTLNLKNAPTVCLACFVLVAGCSATQFSAGNRHLLEALQTAVSAKNDQWLDAVAKQIEDQRGKGTMSSAEYSAFAAIIQNAKAGKWDAAQSRVFALSEAQRPTADDLARIQKRPPK